AVAGVRDSHHRRYGDRQLRRRWPRQHDHGDLDRLRHIDRDVRTPLTVGYAARMPTFEYAELLPAGHHDDTPFRRLTSDPRATLHAGGHGFLEVAPEALTLLARTAMHDIAHLLRPGHLAQLRAILDDAEASANDRFVALELLKNANIAAGGVLPG